MKFITKLKLLGEKAAMSDTGIAASEAASKVRRKSVQVFTSASKGIGDNVGFGAWLTMGATRKLINRLGDLRHEYEQDLQHMTPEKDPEKV